MHQAFYKISLNAASTQVAKITLDIVLKDVISVSGEMFIQ
jgi:hypothetical protein